MRGRSKWYIGGACFLLSLFFIFPVLAYWVISSFVLPPTRLKSLLITEMAKYVKGEFDCHSVELTYWETWPLAGIAIIGGSYSAPADTLFPEKPKLKVEFDKLLVRVNAMDYWQKGLITLKELSLECPDLYVRLGDNQPFDLLYEDRIPQKSPVGSLFEDLRMEIRQLALEDGHWVVENIEQKTRLDCIGMRLALSGMLISDNGRLALSCACDSSRLQTGGNLLRNDSPVSLECLFHADWQKRLVRVESAKLLIRNLPFELSGSFRQESSKRLWMDASLNLSASDLEELLTYVPEPYASKFQSYTLKGNTALATTFKGYLDERSFPDVHLSGSLTDGSIVKKKEPHGLDSVALDFSFSYPSLHPEDATMEIKDLNVSGLNCLVKGKALVKNLFQNPFCDLSIQSDLDFTRLGEEFFSPDTIQLFGRLRSDLSLVFTGKDLQKGRYERIWGEGLLDIDRIHVRSDVYGLSFFAENTYGEIGYRPNKSRFIRQREVLGLSLRIDTINMRLGTTQVALSDLDLASNTGLQQDTNAITPVTTHLRVGRLQSNQSGQVAFLSGKTELHLGVKPAEQDKGKIALAFAFTSDSLEYLNLPSQQAMKVLRSRVVSELYPDKETRWAHLANLDELFSNCEVKGILTFEQLRSFSRQFPVQVNMKNTQLGFKNNRLILNNAEIQAGKSDAVLNGEIVTYPRDGMKKRLIEADLSLRSDQLDWNELRQALMRGKGLEGDRRTKQEDPISLLNVGDLDEAIRKMEENQDSWTNLSNQLLDIPENWMLSLSLNAHRMIFSDFDMNEVSGKVSLKERSAYCDFSVRTNMGNTYLQLLYKNQSTKRSDVYLNWNLSQIQVGKLRKVFPAMGTLFPMLNSIDGVLDCDLAAYCPIDSTLNVDLSALSAVCSLDGKNMVLFTNETFHQIASKLRFKDRERNMIDHISADFVAKNHQIEILPFRLDMDRYSFIVGGQHSMDMSFNYHIDVLKSPIPFNFGLDVNGKVGDFKYNLGKTRYTILFNRPIQHEEYRMSKQRRLDEEKVEILREFRNVIP